MCKERDSDGAGGGQREAKVHFETLTGATKTGTSFTVERMSPLTVIFGRNGSGKSQLLRAFRDAHEKNAHYVAPERAGTIALNAAFIKIGLDAGSRQTGPTNLVPDYHERAVARIMTYFQKRGNYRGSELPGNPAEIENYLSRILPDFTVGICAETPPYSLDAQGRAVTNINDLSSGEAQLFS